MGWFRRLSTSGRLFVLIAALLLAIALGFVEENWRGRSAWETCRRGLEAKAVPLDWSKLAPAPVPDEQNFAMTPFLAPLFDFNAKPFQPGQTAWRDTVGHDRAMKFAVELAPADKPGKVSPMEFSGQFIDLEAALDLLQPKINSGSTSERKYSSRAEVATALLPALEPYQAVLEELRAASHRPYSRFNIEYDARDPMSILLPHLSVLLHVGKAVGLRASAELAVQKNDAALEDVKLMLYLADSIQREPFLISLEVRSRLLKRTDQVIWEGLAQRRWNGSQLRDLQERLTSFALLKDLEKNLQAERAAFGNAIFACVRGNKNQLRMWIGSGEGAPLSYLLAGPNGWFYLEQVSYQQLFQTRILPGFDAEAGRFLPKTIEENSNALEHEFHHYIWRHTAFSKLLLPQHSILFRKIALSQTRLAEAILACALERYRLANGKFPEELASLLPQFIQTLPVDPCSGQPLKYNPGASSQFLLYGTGWNETDDGGAVAMKTDGSDLELDQGDWVWPPYPNA